MDRSGQIVMLIRSAATFKLSHMTTSTITPDTLIRRSESILSSELENEIVMMDIQEGNYYGLEEPGTRIWELAENPVTVRDVCNSLQQEYEIEAEQCQREVIAFVEELQSRKVVELVNT